MAVAVSPPPVRSAGPLSERLLEVAGAWARSQHTLVVLSVAFADSGEWAAAGSPSAAHWLAAVADVEESTAREWVRIGRKLRVLPTMAEAFESGELSYSKVRTLTRLVTPANEGELVPLAVRVPAGDLGRALARWLHGNSDPEDLAAYHERMRSVRWRTDSDGMVIFTLRLPPFAAGCLIAWLTTWVMTRRRQGPVGTSTASPASPGSGRSAASSVRPDASADAPPKPDTSPAPDTEPDMDQSARPSATSCGAGGPDETDAGTEGRDGTVGVRGAITSDPTTASAGASDASAPSWSAASAEAHPTLAQQHADAVRALVSEGGGCVEAEVVVHVRGEGSTMDDGTPVPHSVVEQLVPEAFLRALIHDADGRPVNASGRQRHPSRRQKRVVKERDRVCVDCGRRDLLEYDHVPPYENSGHTVIEELELRCAPCHHRRHAA